MDFTEYSVLQQSIVHLVENLKGIDFSLTTKKYPKRLNAKKKEDVEKDLFIINEVDTPDYLIWNFILNQDNTLQRIFTECNIDADKLSKTSNIGDDSSTEEAKNLICKKIGKGVKEREDGVASVLVNQKVNRLFQNSEIKNLKELLLKIKDKLKEEEKEEEAQDTGWTDLRVFQSVPFFLSLYKYNPESIINFFETSQPLKEDFVWFYPRKTFYEEFDKIGDWSFFIQTLRGAGTIVLFDEKIFCELMKFDYDAIFNNGKIIDDGSLQSESWKNYFKNITFSCSSFLYKKLVLYHLNNPTENFLNNYLKKEEYQELNGDLKNINFIKKKSENEKGFYCSCKVCKKSLISNSCDLFKSSFPKKSSSCVSTPIDPKQIFPIPIKYHQLYEYQLLNSGIQIKHQNLKKIGHAAPAMGGKKTERRKRKSNRKKKKSIKRKRKKKSIKRR